MQSAIGRDPAQSMGGRNTHRSGVEQNSQTGAEIIFHARGLLSILCVSMSSSVMRGGFVKPQLERSITVPPASQTVADFERLIASPSPAFCHTHCGRLHDPQSWRLASPYIPGHSPLFLPRIECSQRDARNRFLRIRRVVCGPRREYARRSGTQRHREEAVAVFVSWLPPHRHIEMPQLPLRVGRRELDFPVVAQKIPDCPGSRSAHGGHACRPRQHSARKPRDEPARRLRGHAVAIDRVNRKLHVDRSEKRDIPAKAKKASGQPTIYRDAGYVAHRSDLLA